MELQRLRDEDRRNEVEVGVTNLQAKNAKDCWQLPEARGGTWKGFSLSPSRSKDALISDFWTPEL